jgi:hypothetical protein
MMFISYIGHLNYIVILFLATGAGLLLIDVRAYGNKKMMKEKKVARSLGWVNLTLGVMSVAAGLIFQSMN